MPSSIPGYEEKRKQELENCPSMFGWKQNQTISSQLESGRDVNRSP